MKEEPAPPSSWFRHVGKLAILAAGPKHQNNGSSCVITLHTGQVFFNPLLATAQVTRHKIKITFGGTTLQKAYLD